MRFYYIIFLLTGIIFSASACGDVANVTSVPVAATEINNELSSDDEGVAFYETDYRGLLTNMDGVDTCEERVWRSIEISVGPDFVSRSVARMECQCWHDMIFHVSGNTIRNQPLLQNAIVQFVMHVSMDSSELTLGDFDKLADFPEDGTAAALGVDGDEFTDALRNIANTENIDEVMNTVAANTESCQKLVAGWGEQYSHVEPEKLDEVSRHETKAQRIRYDPGLDANVIDSLLRSDKVWDSCLDINATEWALVRQARCRRLLREAPARFTGLSSAELSIATNLLLALYYIELNRETSYPEDLYGYVLSQARTLGWHEDDVKRAWSEIELL